MKKAKSKVERQTKRLDRPEIDFYATVLAAIGPPPSHKTTSTFVYDRGKVTLDQWRYVQGTGAFVLYSEYGKGFTQCVMQCGEAKARARYWFVRFRRWCAAITKEQT